MKTTTMVQEIEREFLDRAQGMFRTYPELLSFCLEDEADPGASTPQSIDQDRFDLYVGLAQEVSDDFQQEMCEAVSAFLTEVVCEHPEALDLLRGRTFARTLH